MRLFYALDFTPETKDSIALLQKDLIVRYPKGFFTSHMNLHLTLCFLGEVEGHSLTLLKEILFSLNPMPLHITFNQLGHFRKRQEDILWLGIEENRELEALQKELAYILRTNNFLLEDQVFHPHVTLALGVKGKKLPAIESLAITSDKINLMHSHEKRNILTYTPLFTNQLQQTTII